MTTFRWLHLSDFHVGKDNYGQRKMFRAILDHVKARCDLGREPNFVFMTGDIANAGRLSEYEEFGEEFMLPLFDILGPSPDRRAYSVPGNHDVDRTKAPFVAREVVIQRAPNFLDPTSEGLAHRQHVLPRFEAFMAGDLMATRDHWLASAAGAFADNRKIGPLAVGLVGINTAWHSQDNNDFGNLAAGADLLDAALRSLGDVNVVLVLGHHPIEWLTSADANSIRAVLANHRAIYLHGHFHKTEAKIEYSAGRLFRTFQAGASFQARDDERWQNRLLWCEVDWSAQTVVAEPFTWVEQDREWRIDGRAFPELNRIPDQARWAFPLAAGPDGALTRPPATQVHGWDIVDARTLLAFARHVSDDEIVRFFDGSVPDWAMALSTHIPRRVVVRTTVEHLRHAPEAKGPTLCTVLGAGGEGKTTAAFQIAAQLLNEDVVDVVLWRTSSAATFDESLLHRIGKRRVAVLADDAHNLIATVRDAWSTPRTVHDGVIYLFCARDTDWIANGGARIDWGAVCRHLPLKFRGLSVEDAEALVAAWSQFGDRGLGRLSTVPRENAVQELLQKAREEAYFQEGAFLGALLRTRIGEGLRNHVRSLLTRFENRSVGKQRRLVEAFAYICAVHAEGLDILTDEILSWTLNMTVAELRRTVIAPLGDEAAATTHGNLVVTRHREIAQVAIDILADEKAYSLVELFQDLVLAADRAANEGRFVLKLRDWRYGLSEHFLSQRRYDVALRLTNSLVKQNPDNPFFVTKLAQILRDSGKPGEAADMMADAIRRVTLARDGTRSFYYEWARDCVEAHRPALAAWLVGVGLADLEGMPLDSHNMKGAFDTLHTAANNLGESSLQPAKESVEQLVRRAWVERERDLPDLVPEPSKLTFQLLESWLTKRPR